MNMITNIYARVFDTISNILGDWFLPTFARFSFAAVLFFYFWNSAKTKLDGILTPSDGGYIQIFPRKFEALGYDSSGFGIFEWFVVTAGAYAEFILPILIVIGLFTRLAALGMMGFVVVQSLTDIVGHGVAGKTLGGWFDGPSDALILDQRLLWFVLFATLLIKGAGPFSLDRVLSKSTSDA